jgi:hypothetical protein
VSLSNIQFLSYKSNERWGEKGYVYLAANVNSAYRSGMCEITSYPITASFSGAFLYPSATDFASYYNITNQTAPAVIATTATTTSAVGIKITSNAIPTATRATSAGSSYKTRMSFLSLFIAIITIFIATW